MAFHLRPSDYIPELLTHQRAISMKAFMNETDAVQHMLPELAFLEALEPRVYEASNELIRHIRESGNKQGIEVFLQEYGLDSEEGIAIMCLAEALLRIPDATTADRLIQATFDETQWEKHLGHSDSWMVNASSWGLLLTGKVVQFSQAEGSPTHILLKLVGKVGEPVIREALKAAMRHIGGQFVIGETIEAALKNSSNAELQGFCFSYDMLGEGARTQAQAEHYLHAYLRAVEHIASHTKKRPGIAAPSLSVKLSGLHPRYQLLQHTRVMDELLPRLKQIVQLAMKHNVPVSIDAEESTRADINLLVFTKLFADPDFAGWDGIGFVLQAYQKRAFYTIDYLAELARGYNKRMPIRLVKGAYWDSEIKAAQLAGLPDYPVFTRKEHTDVSYLACAGKILSAGCFYPQFATHNVRTVCAITTMARHYGIATDAFEFQRLHGMGEDLYNQIVQNYRCRIYAPVGEHKDLLAYLIRRLLENGANTSFVHLLMDDATPIEKLLEDPITKSRALECTPNPLIPLPAKLYGASRLNSAGVDFGNLAMCKDLSDAVTNNSYKLAAVSPTPAHSINALFASAANNFDAWSTTSLSARCNILESVADRLSAQRNILIQILTHEGRKTIADAVAEVREAIDFCRYYAAHAHTTLRPETLQGATGESNILSLHPRGTFICISPWNFPLAIFTGQVAAALVAGNSVIAKPAEQTPAIAAFAIKIFHEAGVPPHVLQLAIGDGTLGATLIQHPHVAGVCFTGSTEVAQYINRALAARDGSIVPFITETGGQNCMVVDSSALLEAAVDDIVLSAFGSAGQRCSALRVLYVQEDVADALITLLQGAMAELVVSTPESFATDIPPVIDAEACDTLLAHIEHMKKEATLLAAAPITQDDEHMIAPHAFEIRSIHQLKKETFGPILHIIRFKAEEMHAVVDAINSTGYGLTFGIHSRIDDTIEFFANRIRAGNIYINRSMIGATVGVQPFGGEGLSGTGPKAGGPHYLLRFVTERTISTNTAAIGGNVGLLTGK